MDYIKLFQSLPNFNLNKQIVLNDSYNPTLYKWDGYWVVDWISDEEDSLLNVVGNSPEEAIKNAVKYINENYPSYYSEDYLDDKEDIKPQSFFTLTPEDGELVTNAIRMALRHIGYLECQRIAAIDTYSQSEKDFYNLLTRLNQWLS